MQFIDNIVYFIVFCFMFYGFKRGFLRELFALCFFFLLYPLLDVFWLKFFNKYWITLLKKNNLLFIFLNLFIFVLFNFFESLMYFLFKKFFIFFVFFLDKILGIVIGLLRGFLIIFVIYNLYNYYLNLF